MGLRQGIRLARELLTTVFLTPRRARRLFRRIRRQARSYAALPLERLDDAAVTEHLIRFANTLLHPATLRRLHEIVSAQSRAYMLLERLLSAWVPGEAERLLAQLMTGLGTLPNTQLTYRLMALSELAREEPRVGAFLANGLDREALRSYRVTLAGTRFLGHLDGLLRDFGHRAPFESDVMSPRFAEEPEPLLRMIQAYVRMPTLENPQRHEAYRRRIREAAKREARLALQQGRSWRAFTVQWTILSVICGALQQLVAQRDENRHVTTLLVAQLRRVALEIGNRAARDGRFATAEDVFFVLWDELPTVLTGPPRDWRALIGARRQERNRHAAVSAPDLLRGDEAAEAARQLEPEGGNGLIGFGVSPGTVTGTVKVIRSPADLRALRGEIAVLPAIEPSLAAIFPLVSGLVAEIGGMLSHAAILAREYGLPAVVNVDGATRRLSDGDHIELDGRSGRIRLLGHGGGAVPQDQRRDHEADERSRHHV